MALAWQVPTSDGGGSISGYRVYRSTVAGGAGDELATLGSVQRLHRTPPPSGTTYYYTVTALNSAAKVRAPTRLGHAAGPDGRDPRCPGRLGQRSGSDGYALFAWTASTDLVMLPSASLAIEQGARSASGVVSDVRALESPDESQRRAGAVDHAKHKSGCDDLPAAYAGTLHLYAVAGPPPPVVSASPSMTARVPASPR